MIYLRRVMGSSMLPAFKPGQLVLFIKKHRYQTGHVILFEHDGLEKIKRIKTIDKNNLQVFGDNQSDSIDSRHFGPIKKELVKGRAVFAL